MSLASLFEIRQQAARTSRAHLSKSVAIVHCCRIIIGEKNLETSSDVERALELALKALKAASDKHAKEQDIVLVYGEAVTAIMMSVTGLCPDCLRDIREHTESAKIKDTDVQATRSSIRKRLKGSVAPNKPNFEVYVRVRADIKGESRQNTSLVPCRETDTLDIVLLTMVLRKRLLLSDNPYFYDKSFDDIANVSTVHEPALAFDNVLRDIPLARNSNFPLLYCLLDHKFGSLILLRSVETQRFANIWRVGVSGKYILKETIGDLRSADWIIDCILINNSDVKIVKRLIPTDSEEGSEVRKDTWLEVFEEVCKAFKEEGGYTSSWTIEVNSAQRVPQSSSLKILAPKSPDKKRRGWFQRAKDYLFS